MPDIARLDEDGVCVAVETVSPEDHRTDPGRRTVALPAHHDMRQRLGQYRWDFLRHAFLPLPGDPLSLAEREAPRLTDELTQGLVEFVEHLERRLGIELPPRTRKAIARYRRIRDPRQRLDPLVEDAVAKDAPAGDAVPGAVAS
jgi:hypothetical protein